MTENKNKPVSGPRISFDQEWLARQRRIRHTFWAINVILIVLAIIFLRGMGWLF